MYHAFKAQKMVVQKSSAVGGPATYGALPLLSSLLVAARQKNGEISIKLGNES